MNHRQKLLRAAFYIAALFGASTFLAQEGWMKKDFMQWNSEDIRKLTTDSPWAHELTMALSPPSGGNFDVGASSGPGGGRNSPDEEAGGERESGSESGRSGGRGGRGSGSSATGSNTVKLVVSWQTALPVKQASVRARNFNLIEAPPEAKEFLNREEPDYVILIEGLPARYAEAARQDVDKLKQSALKAGKREIHLLNANFQPRRNPSSSSGARAGRGGAQTIDVFLFFPRTEPIRIEDNEVEVIAKLATLSVKKKFKLKDMVVNGKLEL